MIGQIRRRLNGMTLLGQQQLLQEAGFANSTRVLTEITSPKTTALNTRLETAQAGMRGVVASQAQPMRPLVNQHDRLARNFNNFSSTVAGPLMGPRTSLASGAANALYGGAQYLQGHPLAQGVAVGGAVAATALVAGKALEFLGVPKLFGPIGRAATHHIMRKLAGAAIDTEAMKSTRDAIGGVAERGITAALNAFPKFGKALDIVQFGFGRVAGVAARSAAFVKLFTEGIGKLGSRFIPIRWRGALGRRRDSRPRAKLEELLARFSVMSRLGSRRRAVRCSSA